MARVLGRQAGVAAEEHRMPARPDDQRRPQRRVAVLQAAAGEVLRRRGRDRQVGAGQRVRFPPVELGDALCRHAPGFEVRADAERGDEGHVAPRQFANRRVVEVIVVIVGDEHQVHRRQCAQRNRAPAGSASARAAATARRAAPRPGRSARAGRRSRSAPSNGRARWRAVRCRVPWPRPRADSPTAAARAARAGRRRREIPSASAARRRRVAQPGQHRVHVAKRVARPKQRGLDALEAQSFRSPAECLHGFPLGAPCTRNVRPAKVRERIAEAGSAGFNPAANHMHMNGTARWHSTRN